MWGFKKKKTDLPENLPIPPNPDGPGLPMPEPIEIPRISGRDLNQNMPNESFESNPFPDMGGLESDFQPTSQSEMDSKLGMESSSSQENMKMERPQYLSIPSEVSFKKYHYVKDDREGHKDFLFLEKSNYSHILDELKNISSLIKDSKDLEPELIDIKTKEDISYTEFSDSMEDVQRKLVYVDKTLFGE
ncbi:hypothetical protein KY334_00550 [Candidatus Woesearchaeota archaeon]|nr:hypothetical protein [Candidatus Woesearchaeota archaeon]